MIFLCILIFLNNLKVKRKIENYTTILLKHEKILYIYIYIIN